ncbi:MAG: hypothetical protein ACFFE5_14710 [Candidatus Thorarchaeota archaeon]
MHLLDNNNNLSESEIQFLYQTHPYLIDRRFLDKIAIPQYPLPSGFADLVILLEDEIVVIELKVEPLQFTHYLQLREYIGDIKQIYKKKKKYQGILIGYQPIDNFDTIYRSKDFDFKVLMLEEDICTRIKICDNCRLANDRKNKKCFNCSSDKFLR